MRITLFLILVVLSSCGNLTDGGTTLTLLVSGKSVAYIPGSGPDDPSQLTYTIHGSGPGILSKTVQGGGSITLSLVPGNWTIQVTASYQGVPYAESKPQSINVQAGGNNAAAIDMGSAWSAGNTEDFGGDPDEYKHFSASDADSDLRYYLNTTAAGKKVAVIVDGTHTINPVTMSVAGTVISLRGSGTIKLGSTNGSLFSANAGATLILRGPNLVGRDNNNTVLVNINNSSLYMYAGEIRDNTNGGNISYGGGVYVGSTSTFTMEGGSITHNIASSAPNFGNGGGVYVGSGGTFTMKGSAVISRNISSIGYGGGVAVLGTTGTATFNMEGGTISNNESHVTGSNGGGGVFLSANSGSAIFTMSNGTISGNTAAAHGGGVNVGANGNFTMNGGAINGANTAINGGGVFVVGISGGSFTKSGGSIAGNTASGTGRAVYINGTTNKYRNVDAGPGDGITLSHALTTPQDTPPWVD
ncbi:hypothetical protein AGMMS50230_10220 [Spirochaetia bacterium]|nr:hypothetical protein AGMMS50230_10220 [Spirochaetia bacterium]